MTRPTLPVMYPVGWRGRIGPYLVEIVEVVLTRYRIKKGVIIGRVECPSAK